MFGHTQCTGRSRDHAKPRTASRAGAKLADAHWDVVKRLTPTLATTCTFAQLQTEGAGFGWVSWVTTLGALRTP